MRNFVCENPNLNFMPDKKNTIPKKLLRWVVTLRFIFFFLIWETSLIAPHILENKFTLKGELNMIKSSIPLKNGKMFLIQSELTIVILESGYFFLSDEIRGVINTISPRQQIFMIRIFFIFSGLNLLVFCC